MIYVKMLAVARLLDQINPDKSRSRFTRARVKNPLGYSLGDQKIPEESSCKYLGIVLRSNLYRVDQVNYITQKGWKALHFVMHVLKKCLAYTSLVHPVVLFLNMGLHARIHAEKDR